MNKWDPKPASILFMIPLFRLTCLILDMLEQVGPETGIDFVYDLIVSFDLSHFKYAWTNGTRNLEHSENYEKRANLTNI